MTFALSLEVLEGDQSIRSLQVQVDPVAAAAFGDFVARVQTERSPHLFFRGFVQYAQWNARRARLFATLHAAYPNAVRLLEGTANAACIEVVHPDVPGLGFVFRFALSLGQHQAGRVNAELRLLPLVTPNVLALDTRGVIAGLDDEFKALRKVRGTEGVS